MSYTQRGAAAGIDESLPSTGRAEGAVGAGWRPGAARIMRSYFASLRIAGLAGAVLGLAVGLLDWSSVWPRLSLLLVVRAAALGWLAGAILSPALGWSLSRRGPAPGRPVRASRRVARHVVTVLGLAPAVVWLAALLPNASLRHVMSGARAPDEGRPNLVLITIDALRADHVGVYGNPDGLTPNLDAFARDATRYDAAYASSPWTLPSFGAVLTSRPPSECGLKIAAPKSHTWYTGEAALPEEVPVLSEQLRRAGYATAAELTNPFLARKRGFKRGFDHFRNEDGPEVGSLTTSNTARAHTVTKNACLWLRMNRRKPFFLWVHYLDPHAPYDSPDTPEKTRADYPQEWRTGRLYWYDNMREVPENTKSRYAGFCRATYAEEVRYADRWAGGLLAELRRLGLYENSLVVITADHGEELFDHDGFEHGHSTHEEVLRVPLLVKWPSGRRAAQQVARTVGLVDLAPTFLAAAEADPMEGVWGRPLPMEDGASAGEVYSEGLLYGREQTAFTGEEYKVIYHPYAGDGEARFEVYNRRRDRAEHHDVGDTGAAAALKERLQAYTEAADSAAREWHPDVAGGGSGESQLDEHTRRKLRSLGYLGE